MATDATGTPTTLGIPKYNPAVDAPSGLGFNAAMDSIDTLIAARLPLVGGTLSGSITSLVSTALAGVFFASRSNDGSPYRFALFNDGRMEWGAGGATRDISLYRFAADVLRTEDTFDVVRGAGSSSFRSLLTTADSSPAFRILGDGRQEWGAGGAAAMDVDLFRSAANVLKTNDTFDAVAYRQGGSALAVSHLASPNARAWRSAALTLTAAATTVIGLDSESFDSGTMHDNATNNSRITVPVAGKYQVNAAVYVASGLTQSNTVALQLRKNGTNIMAQDFDALGRNRTYKVSDVVSLAANDYLEIIFVNNEAGGGVTSPAEANVYMSVVQVA